MDGTQGAGLEGFSQCVDQSKMRTVETLSFAMLARNVLSLISSRWISKVPRTDVIEHSLGFIAQNAIHFAIETDHRVEGEFDYRADRRLFSCIGYKAFTSTEYGIQLPVAQPPADSA